MDTYSSASAPSYCVQKAQKLAKIAHLQRFVTSDTEIVTLLTFLINELTKKIVEKIQTKKKNTKKKILYLSLYYSHMILRKEQSSSQLRQTWKSQSNHSTNYQTSTPPLMCPTETH